jgi:hypothetical protein
MRLALPAGNFQAGSSFFRQGRPGHGDRHRDPFRRAALFDDGENDKLTGAPILWYFQARRSRVSIRTKIIAIVLPLLIAGLVIGGISASSLARNAVTRVIVTFMTFKTDQLSQYMDGQWRILVENEMTSRQDMVQAAQAGIESYARGLLLSDSELVFALDSKGTVVMATGKVDISDAENAPS